MSLRPFTPVDTEDPRGAFRVVRANLAAVDTAGGLAAIQNPFNERAAVIVAAIDVTTAATGACTADVGVAANATTLDDTLIDGADVGAGAIFTTNLLQWGNTPTGNAAGHVVIASGSYVTASVASGASAGIVGTLQVCFLKLDTVAS